MSLNPAKSAMSGVKPNDEETTAKVLEDLKAKLLSGRDKFLLSERDTVPQMINRKKSVEEQAKLFKKLSEYTE